MWVCELAQAKLPHPHVSRCYQQTGPCQRIYFGSNRMWCHVQSALKICTWNQSPLLLTNLPICKCLQDENWASELEKFREHHMRFSMRIIHSRSVRPTFITWSVTVITPSKVGRVLEASNTRSLALTLHGTWTLLSPKSRALSEKIIFLLSGSSVHYMEPQGSLS